MSKALDPRETELGSHYRWLKGGLRLLGRASASWLLVWLAWAIGVLMLATPYPMLAFFLMGISMMTFDLNLLAFDQLASSRPRLTSAVSAFLLLLRKNARIYLFSFAFRVIAVVLIVMFSAGVMSLLEEYAGLKTSPTANQEGMFGLSWAIWTYAWFLPSLFQRGGVMSLRAWLVRREGLTEKDAANLEGLALTRNLHQILAFQRWIIWPSILCVFVLPILLPVLELFWVASMRCLYHDIFQADLGIEEQSQEIALNVREVVLLPVSR